MIIAGITQTTIHCSIEPKRWLYSMPIFTLGRKKNGSDKMARRHSTWNVTATASERNQTKWNLEKSVLINKIKLDEMKANQGMIFIAERRAISWLIIIIAWMKRKHNAHTHTHTRGEIYVYGVSALSIWQFDKQHTTGSDWIPICRIYKYVLIVWTIWTHFFVGLSSKLTLFSSSKAVIVCCQCGLCYPLPRK